MLTLPGRYGARLAAVFLPLLCLGLVACSPASLNHNNLLRGARAETFILNHAALCSRLPATEAIEAYANGSLPETSALAREVKAWDLSGLLDIVRSADGRWVIMPSAGMKKIPGFQVRTGQNGQTDAICFGRLWIESVVSFEQNKPLGVEDGITVRFRASLKDPHMLKYFKDLKVEAYDSTEFNLTTGVAFGSTLQQGFEVELALRPSSTGWYLAKNAPPEDKKP